MSITTQTHLISAEKLGNLPDEPLRHKLIKGDLLTMPLPKLEHGDVVANLVFLLSQHIRANQLGKVFAEFGYKIESDPDTVLGPDVSFLAHDRLALNPEGYHDGPPDLAIEVISPGDRSKQIERKLNRWLEAGTKSVWHVYPRRRTVEVTSSTGERKTFYETDELVDDTGPGFRVKVSEIFE